MIHQRLLSLNSGVGNVTNLLAIKLFPFLGMESMAEWNYGQGIDKINERISDIALVLKVNGEIEKVIL
ncbi:hypothetical protein D3C80_1730100 [compost metagenome]